MLARVFDKTKRFLSRSPSVHDRNSESRDTPQLDAADVDDTMVTTRGGTETPGATATPRSSARDRAGKRQLDALETPTQVKRPRKNEEAVEDESATVHVATRFNETPVPAPELFAEEPIQESVETVPETDVPTEGHKQGLVEDELVPVLEPETSIQSPVVDSVEAGLLPRTSTEISVPEPEEAALEPKTTTKVYTYEPLDETDTIHVLAQPSAGPLQTSVEEDDYSDMFDFTAQSSEDHVPEGNLPIRRRSSPRVMIANKSFPVARKPHEPRPTTPIRDTQEDAEGSATPKAQVTEISVSTERDDASKTLEVSQTTTRLLNEVPSLAHESTQEEMAAPPEMQIEEEQPNTVETSQTISAMYDEVPSSTYDSEQAPIASQDHAAPSSQPLADHVRFGSEESTAVHDTTIINERTHDRLDDSSPPPAPLQDEPIDDSASDSDEAPEVVTTAHATRTTQNIQQTALHASAAQAAAQEAKRQAREARIAEERAQKRLREEKKAKKLERRLAKQQKHETTTSPPADSPPTTTPSTKPSSLPSLLPASLLSNLPATRPPTPPPTRRGKTAEQRHKEKLAHHVKFLERAEKPVKDVKRGKVSVAVLGKQASVLPPKVNRDTRHVRERWLKGRGGEAGRDGRRFVKGKVERRHGGSGKVGFLRGED